MISLKQPQTGASGDPAAVDPAAPVLERCRRLAEDTSFEEVRRFKKENLGHLAIGYMPIYIPRPLLEAQGCRPVAIFGGGDQVEIIRGDSFFQSYICHIPRSTVELGLRGDLDCLDGLVFPSICDVIRNLGGIWNLIAPQQFVFYIDLPHNFRPDIGGRFYRRQMEQLAGELANRGALPLDAERLTRAIEIENRRRQALADLDALRRREPWKLLASEAYLVARAGGILSTEEHTALIKEVIDAVAERSTRPYDNVRVVVIGSFCEQPPLSLIKTLEKAGCYIVDDDFQLGLRYLEGPIEVGEGDPLDALAMAYLERGSATASRYIGDGTKGEALLARVAEAEADGVVFAAASFCDPALLDQPMLESALEREGVPYTGFKFSENTGQFQVIREQAGAFSDSVKLWGKSA